MPSFTHGSITNGSDAGEGLGKETSYLYLSTGGVANSPRISEYTLDAEL